MRALLIFTLLTLALPVVDASQDARPPDRALIQRVVDTAPGDARRQLAAEIPEILSGPFRLTVAEAGLAHQKQGRKDEAIRTYETSIELADLAGSPRGRVAATISLSSVYGQAGDYNESVRLLNEALAQADPVRDEDLIANAANNLGNIYRRRSEYDEALEAYMRALASNEAAKRDASTARTLNNLGMVYQAQGDFRLAVDYYLRSLELKERVSPPDDVVTTTGNIGGLLALQGNKLQALEYLERALALAERSKQVRLMVDTLANIGRILIETEQYDEAEVRLIRANRIAEQAGAKDQVAATLASLANVDIQRRQWTRAGEYLARARAIFTDIGDPLGTGQVLMSLARMELDRGRVDAGVALAQQARDTIAATGTAIALIDAEMLYGDALTRLRRWNEAIATFGRAIDLVERGLTLVAGDTEDRYRFLENSTNAYFGLAGAYASAGRAAEALTAAERGRARTLLDILASGRPGEDELSEAERARQIELDTTLNALNERVAADRARARTGKPADPSLMAAIERLRQSRDEFYLGLDAKHPRLRFARGEAPVLTSREVAATLPARSALVEFVAGPRGVWVMVLTPQAKGEPRLIVKAAALPADRVITLAAEFTRQVATRDLAFGVNARALYDALFGPIDAELTGIDHLIVVPHAGLWEVPFQALQTPRRRYLIEEHAIAYAPSASTLKLLESRRRPRPAQPRVVAFGDPRLANAKALPHAAREAREVAGVYGIGNSVVALEADATESRFRQVAPRADIVHIATHGVLDNASPLFSYLRLAGNSAQRSADGRLEGHEVINMQIGAELVVLSACETARGRVSNGEGVVGLSWALFAAGASTTAVSLWPVDSASTTDLMSAFHRERRRLISSAAPAPTAQALRASQIAALARPESRHPFYWAGFVVIGVP